MVVSFVLNTADLVKPDCLHHKFGVKFDFRVITRLFSRNINSCCLPVKH